MNFKYILILIVVNSMAGGIATLVSNNLIKGDDDKAKLYKLINIFWQQNQIKSKYLLKHTSIYIKKCFCKRQKIAHLFINI